MINTLNGILYDKQEVDNEVEQLSTKIDTSAEQLSTKIDNNAEQLSTKIDEVKEQVNDIILTGGGVSLDVFNNTISRLDTEDLAIKDRLTELENNPNNVSINTFNNTVNRLDTEDASIKVRLNQLNGEDAAIKDRLDRIENVPTYIIDSQEKFDAFCLASNASEADGNDYSHVLIKNGNYMIIEGHGIRLDNAAVPILSITGESQDGVVIDLQATYAFYCLEKENQITQHISTFSITAFGQGYYIFYKVDHVLNATLYAKAVSQGSPTVYSHIFYYCDDVHNCLIYHNNFAQNESSSCTNCTFSENDTVYSENDIWIGYNSVYNSCIFNYNERTEQYKASIAQFSRNTFINCTLNIPVELNLENAIIRQCTITTSRWYCYTQNSPRPLAIENSTISIDTVEAEPSVGSFYPIIQNAIVNNVNISVTSIGMSKQFHSPSATGIILIESSKASNVNIQIDRAIKYVTIFSTSTTENCHVFINEADEYVYCFNNCETLVNCSNYIDNTHYGAGTAIVFAGCKNLTNCTAYLTRLTKESMPNNYNSKYSIGYYRCNNLRDCCVTLDAKYIAADTTQASYVQCIGYSTCSILANCTFEHTSLQPYAHTSITAYAICRNLTSCIFIPHEFIANDNKLNVQIDTTQSVSVNYKVYYVCMYMTNCYGNAALYSTNLQNSSTPQDKMLPIVFYLYALDSTIIAQTNSIQIYFNAFDTCSFLSNCATLNKTTESYVTIKTVSNSVFSTDSYVMNNPAHFHQCTYLTNCAAVANNGVIQFTHAVQNCSFGTNNVDNTTCSASQSYKADYTLADTPAGGFNNITS